MIRSDEDFTGTRAGRERRQYRSLVDQAQALVSTLDEKTLDIFLAPAPRTRVSKNKVIFFRKSGFLKLQKYMDALFEGYQESNAVLTRASYAKVKAFYNYSMPMFYKDLITYGLDESDVLLARE